jgi:hypothetical protein
MNKNEYYQLLQLGFLRRILREREENKAKAGILRGGNSSALVNGRVIGLDPRETLLRYLGMEMPMDFDSYLMMDAGLFNEDAHSNLLKEAGATFKCEEEVPVIHSITTDAGTEVAITGRPDRAMLNDEGQLTVIIEEKQIASSWKAKELSHWGMGNPKPENVVQAAHYSMFHGMIPAILAYSSRSWHSIKSPKDNLLQPDHRAILGDGDWMFGAKPFMALYELEWQDDTLYLEGRKTAVTSHSIKEYYKYVADCAEKGVIPNVHYSDTWGNPMTKSKREKYYDWKHIPEDDFNEWVALIQAECDEAWAGVEEQLQELEELLA